MRIDEIGRTSESNQFNSLLDRFRTAIRKLESWGVRISLHSRLHAYEHRLESVGDDPSVPVPTEIIEQLMFDLREIDEITEIVESFSTEPTLPEVRKLQLMIGGVEHPDEDIKSAGRDMQYELYLRLLFAKSQVVPVLGEPDLLLTWRGRRFPLEAKRPKSAARFDDALRKAVSQIGKHKEYGIAAISLDQVVRPSRHHLSVYWQDQMTEIPSKFLHAFIDKYRNKIASRVRGRNVAALFLTLRLPTRVTTTGQLALATGLHIETLVGTEHPSYRAIELLESVMRANL